MFNKKEYMKEYSKLYRETHKKEIQLLAKNHRIKNREKMNKQHRDWLITHKEYELEYQRNKRKININFKISKNLRTRINHALKGITKSENTLKILGCSLEFFKIYIEQKFTSGMSWDNYGLYGWHIDHIIPCCKFDLSKDSEQKLCFNYTNLQPLWAEDNLKKCKSLF